MYVETNHVLKRMQLGLFMPVDFSIGHKLALESDGLV